jgi:hypothetical protein
LWVNPTLSVQQLSICWISSKHHVSKHTQWASNSVKCDADCYSFLRETKQSFSRLFIIPPR